VNSKSARIFFYISGWFGKIEKTEPFRCIISSSCSLKAQQQKL